MRRARSITQKAAAIICGLLLPLSVGFAQGPAGPPSGPSAVPQTAPLLSPDQLDNLVAPIALYPDPLLSQVLAASTYPLEIAEAQQWLQQNSSLQGSQLIDAAKQQNWDPSVQALVAFPDAFRLLANDIRWTTDLGNAFLAQQSDVMSAIQRMRARAQANGRLNTTPQQAVTTDTQDGQSAIQIQPADPQVVYVPVYQPEYVWGPPVWGAYPNLWYPSGFGFGFGFGPGIYMSALFPGWGGWGGWGWGCGWFGNGLFINAGFFGRYGFHGGFGGGFGGFGGRGFGGREAWAHNPAHRMGVPYSSQAVASRFNSHRFTGSSRYNSQFGGNRSQFSSSRSQFGSQVTGGNRGFQSANRGTNGYAGASRQTSPNYRQASPNYSANSGSRGNRTPAQSYRGYSSSAGNYRSAQSLSRSYGYSNSAPRAMSAPRSLGGSSSGRSSGFSGGRSSGFSGGHSSGFSGGHSGGGGGHSSGGHGGGGRR